MALAHRLRLRAPTQSCPSSARGRSPPCQAPVPDDPGAPTAGQNATPASSRVVWVLPGLSGKGRRGRGPTLFGHAGLARNLYELVVSSAVDPAPFVEATVSSIGPSGAPVCLKACVNRRFGRGGVVVGACGSRCLG